MAENKARDRGKESDGDIGNVAVSEQDGYVHSSEVKNENEVGDKGEDEDRDKKKHESEDMNERENGQETEVGDKNKDRDANEYNEKEHGKEKKVEGQNKDRDANEYNEKEHEKEKKVDEGQNKDRGKNEERDEWEDGDKNKNGGKNQASGENDKETKHSDDIAEGTEGTGTDAGVKNEQSQQQVDNQNTYACADVRGKLDMCSSGSEIEEDGKKAEDSDDALETPSVLQRDGQNHGSAGDSGAVAVDGPGTRSSADSDTQGKNGREQNTVSNKFGSSADQGDAQEEAQHENVVDGRNSVDHNEECQDLVEGAEGGETNTEIVKKRNDLQIPLSGDAVLEYSADQTDDSVAILDIIPTPIDPDVISLVTGSLHGELRFTELCEDLKKLGGYLRLGTNAVADDATLLIKVQSALFDVVKLCDAVSLLMQNFRMSSNNIIEKLHVAFLYLLDGFPDFAKTDIECISKDVKSMQERGSKCLEVVSHLKVKIEKKSELWIKCGQKNEEFVSLASQLEWIDAFEALPDMSRRNNQLTVPSTDAYEEISDAEVQQAKGNIVEYPENNAKSEMGIKDVQDGTSAVMDDNNIVNSSREGHTYSAASVGLDAVDEGLQRGDDKEVGQTDDRAVVCTKLSGDFVVIESPNSQPSQKSVTTADPAPAEEKRAASAVISALIVFKKTKSVIKGFFDRRSNFNAAGSPTQQPAGLGNTSNTETTKLPSQDEPKVPGDREKMEKAKQVKNSYIQAQLLQQLLQLSIKTLETIEDLIEKTNTMVHSWDMECKDVIEPWLVVGFREAEKLTPEDQKRYWKSLWFQQRARDYYNRWCALGDFCDNHHREVKKVRREVDAFYTENLYPREAVQFAWRLAEDIDDDAIKDLVEKHKLLNTKM